MAYKQTQELNEQEILSFLHTIVDKIKTEENPFELNRYRSLFRKAVPFTLRAYFAAYMLKQINEGKSISSFKVYPSKTRYKKEDKKNVIRSERDAKRKESKPEARVSLPEELSTTLFISVGRNRRVYPRDIITLIMQNCGIEREHIGEIRVLDNYSFVQVLNDSAPIIIEKLNNFPYRGRSLSVSHSRKKDEIGSPSESEDFSQTDS